MEELYKFAEDLKNKNPALEDKVNKIICNIEEEVKSVGKEYEYGPIQFGFYLLRNLE